MRIDRLGWFICGMFAFLSVNASFMATTPETESTRNIMMLSFACDALVAAGVSFYLGRLPMDHWVRRSRAVRAIFVILAVIVATLVVLVVVSFVLSAMVAGTA